MHSHQRSRGKVLFEVLCALALAASFAGAWDDIRSPPLLGSAAIVALFAVYWSFGLFARRERVEVAQPAVADTREPEMETAVQEEVLAFEPEVLPQPEPVAAAPKKRPARKTKKAAVVVAPFAEPLEPVAFEEPVFDGPPLEQLFDPQPFVRQPRAFGRKSRGPRPVPAA